MQFHISDHLKIYVGTTTNVNVISIFETTYKILISLHPSSPYLIFIKLLKGPSIHVNVMQIT